MASKRSEATEVWPEKRVFAACLSHVFGERAPRIADLLESKRAALRQGRTRLDHIKKTVDFLGNQEHEMAPGVPFTFGTLIDNGNASVPRLETAPRPIYVFDQTGSKTDTWNERGLTEHGPYTTKVFTPNQPRICVVCQQSMKGHVEQFLHKFDEGIKLPPAPASRDRNRPAKPQTNYFEKGFRRKYALQDIQYEFFLAENGSVDSYKRACQRAIEKNGNGQKWDLAFVQIEESFRELPTSSNPYFVSKASFLTHQIPVQEFQIEKTRKPDRDLMFVLNTMGLAIRLDGRAFAFTLAIAVFAGIFSGFIPALRTAGTLTDANEGLKESGRGSSPARGRQRLRAALVIAEMAAALVVLIGAGLMAKGSRSLLDVNRNLRPQSILTMQIAVSDKDFSQPYQRAAFFDRALERLAALPGVEGAALVSNVPYGYNETMETCEIEGQPVASASERRNAQVQVVSPNYLETVGIPLLQGRGFRQSDSLTSLPVAIVSEKFAARYWPGENPLSRRIRLAGAGSWLTVIGVAKDTRYTPWTVEIAPAIYQSYRQQPLYYTYLALRTRTDPEALSIPARSTIAALNTDVPLWEIKPLDRVIANKLVGLSYVAVMLSVLGAIATILSAAGIYGLIAYSVSERTHEIGIRLALGAARTDLLGMLARRGLLLTSCGLGIGLLIAIPLARLLSNLIYGVSAMDAATFGESTAMLAAVALLACYFPARKAMSVDPITALHRE